MACMHKWTAQCSPDFKKLQAVRWGLWGSMVLLRVRGQFSAHWTPSTMPKKLTRSHDSGLASSAEPRSVNIKRGTSEEASTLLKKAKTCPMYLKASNTTIDFDSPNKKIPPPSNVATVILAPPVPNLDFFSGGTHMHVEEDDLERQQEAEMDRIDAGDRRGTRFRAWI